MKKCVLMSKLEVSFSHPDEAWITLTLCCGEKTVTARLSYIYESLSDLARVLRSILLDQGYKAHCFLTPDELLFAQTYAPVHSFGAIVWLGEAEQFEMFFDRQGDAVTLELLRYPGVRRNIREQEHVFSVEGTYGAVCLPFWRALRSLPECFSQHGADTRWIDPSLLAHINRLTAALRRVGIAN